MKKFQLNEDIVFTAKKDVFALWNLKNGEQYQIYDQKYLDRIYELTTLSGYRSATDNIDEELIDAGILELTTFDKASESPRQQWGWDDIAKSSIWVQNTISRATCLMTQRIQRLLTSTFARVLPPTYLRFTQSGLEL
ncbi:hypothetical protein I5S62_21840 [Pseudomonas putida]|uniref:hypothetical protein n=1 Tax=Pseudomonas putida TaxID=303 RepID=UPI0018D81783|nr:hypothetical protein [Pseudomonas putida]MBH3391744.1 hypothetical protein [Pseudomonas putida]